MLQILLTILTVYILGFLTISLALVVCYAIDAARFGNGLDQLLDDWRGILQLALSWLFVLVYAVAYGIKRLVKTAPDCGYDPFEEYDPAVFSPEKARARGAGQRPPHPFDRP